MVEDFNPYQPPEAQSFYSHDDGYALAGRGRRLVAQLVNSLIAIMVSSVAILAAIFLSSLLSTASTPEGDLLVVIMVVATLTVLLALAVLQTIFITTRGQSLGKMMLGVRIVMVDDGSNPGFARAVLLRYFVNQLLCQVPFYGLVDILLIFAEDRRCVHDHIAGTVVVYA